MNKRKIESLAEAIVKFSGYQNPDSAVYAARNPGGLKAYTPLHEQDAEGNRVFRSLIDGYQALFYDLQLKLSGKSKAHLRLEHSLVELAGAYGLPALTTAQAWSKYLRKALADESISHKTTLKYFLEESQ